MPLRFLLRFLGINASNALQPQIESYRQMTGQRRLEIARELHDNGKKGTIMVYRGRVENGVVVLADDVKLADGTQVKVEPVDTVESAALDDSRSLYERFRDVIGKATGLPEDFAEQHDDYIHGTPKK